MIESIEQLSQWVTEASRGVAFTGAGISTESGIPDFRSPDGVWARYQPVYFDEFMASADARYEYWRQKCEGHRDFAMAKPNAGHRVLAKWEAAGLFLAVVTQNIDGLHQDAGSRHVLELHGTARHIQCMDCAHREPAGALVKQFIETDRVPNCPACGDSGRMKHATVSFGQMLPRGVLAEAETISRDADLYLAIGSSLVVTPAADLPRLSKCNGAKLVIINRDPTPLDDIADLVIRESIGETLSAVEKMMDGGQ